MKKIQLIHIPLSFILILTTIGCASSVLQSAHTTVVTLGQIWAEADAVFAVSYEQARIEARESSSTLEERNQKLIAWENARSALISSGLLIKTAALSISIAEDGYQSDWSIQLSRAIDAINAMYKAIKIIGIELSESTLSQ